MRGFKPALLEKYGSKYQKKKLEKKSVLEITLLKNSLISLLDKNINTNIELTKKTKYRAGKILLALLS